MRRTADLIALIAASLWLGGNIAIFATAIVMFSLAAAGHVEAATSDVGELFGPVFSTWTVIGGGLLAIILVARIASWVKRLRTGTFSRSSLIGLAFLAIVVTTYVLGAIAIERTEAARGDVERATETAPEQLEAFQRAFNEVHHRSESLMSAHSAALAAMILALAASIWRQSRRLPASAPGNPP